MMFKMDQKLQESKDLRRKEKNKFTELSTVSDWRKKLEVKDEPVITLHDALLEKSVKLRLYYEPV